MEYVNSLNMRQANIFAHAAVGVILVAFEVSLIH